MTFVEVLSQIDLGHSEFTHFIDAVYSQVSSLSSDELLSFCEGIIVAQINCHVCLWTDPVVSKDAFLSRLREATVERWSYMKDRFPALDNLNLDAVIASFWSLPLERFCETIHSIVRSSKHSPRWSNFLLAISESTSIDDIAAIISTLNLHDSWDRFFGFGSRTIVQEGAHEYSDSICLLFFILSGTSLDRLNSAVIERAVSGLRFHSDRDGYGENLPLVPSPQQCELIAVIKAMCGGAIAPPLTACVIGKAKSYMRQLNIHEQSLDLDVACLLGYPADFIERLIKWKLILSQIGYIDKGEVTYSVFPSLFAPNSPASGHHPLVIAVHQGNVKLFDTVASYMMTYYPAGASIPEIAQCLRDVDSTKQYADLKKELLKSSYYDKLVHAMNTERFISGLQLM
jgi:hypothetical protein